jgi:hypothetical protein
MKNPITFWLAACFWSRPICHQNALNARRGKVCASKFPWLLGKKRSAEKKNEIELKATSHAQVLKTNHFWKD